MVKHRFQEPLCTLKLNQETATVLKLPPGNCCDFSDCKLLCYLQYAHQFHFEVFIFLYTSGLLGKLFFHWGEGILLSEI